MLATFPPLGFRGTVPHRKARRPIFCVTTRPPTGAHIDWLLIVSAQHMARALTIFIGHYNVHRAHRSLGLTPPNARPPIERWSGTRPMAVNRRDRLGGLVHEYERAA
jgi:hypothetical protein